VAEPRILGVVGGTGPASTVDYYQALVAGHSARRNDSSFPRILINSIDGDELKPYVLAGDHAGAAAILGEAVARLAVAGASLALFAAVTTHFVFDEVAAAAPIPMLSIVEATARAVAAAGYRRPGVFATRPTTDGAFFARPFEALGIDLVRPTEAERDWIHDAYFRELFNGVFTDATRAGLVEIATAMRDRDGIDALILGGTELPLILTEPTCAGVPVVTTTQAHVAEALDWLEGSEA
jgi:aspartate racemase